ncbi:MAG: xanthine dehydrogenase family protein subunit M [Acidobacteria bacterium]|nr:xanthine dehydrogenase family protein subunit M [Acidobacteriota bacterium]
MKNFAYVKARSIEEAARELGSPGARLHAGGTDLLGCIHDEVIGVDKVVSISGLTALRGISPGPGGGLRIGSLTTISEVAANPTVGRDYAVLAQAARDVASPQLRNQGTIGGNICQRPRCWYFRGDFHCAKKGGELCYAMDGENQYHAIFGGGPSFYVHPSDTAVALAALQAQLVIQGPGGSRTVKMGDFFIEPIQDLTKENVLAPNEIVTEIQLPPAGSGLRTSYRKIRARQAWDFAMTSVALALQTEGGRIARASVFLGGVGPFPWRAAAAEKLLAGKTLDAALAAAAGKAATEGASPLRENAYKVDMVRGAVEESLLAFV